MKAVPFVLAVLLAGGVAHAQPAQPLRAAMLDRFDTNRDGRLDRVERRHAIKALRRLARHLARQQQRDMRRAARMNRIIQRYDLDGDGNVGPGEAPPALQRRLRKLDRNGDGWVDDADF